MVFNFLDATSTEMIIRLILAVILGGIVGIEREITHRPAGLRTHMLVSLGAALFAVTAVLNFASSDIARVVANIVVGIGFIGGGAIVASKGKVHGVTTAASLWIVAAIGFSVGMGSYTIATASTIIVFLILQLKRFEKNLNA